MPSIQFEQTQGGSFVHCPNDMASDLDFHLRCNDVGTSGCRAVSDFGGTPDEAEITITKNPQLVESAIDSWMSKKGIRHTKHHNGDEIIWEWSEEVQALGDTAQQNGD